MSPTTDDLRRVLEERATARVDDVLALADPAHAAAGPRLAAVHARIRRTRRLRAAGAASAVAAVAVLAATVVVPGFSAPDRREEPPSLPAARTAPATFDERGGPPLEDPWGHGLTAATSVSVGTEQAALTVTPGEDPDDAGFSVAVRCSGDPSALAAWFVGGRAAGTVPCDGEATFASRTPRQWVSWGVRPGTPVEVSVRFVDRAPRAGEPAPAGAVVTPGGTSAVLAVYGGDAELSATGSLNPDRGGLPLLARTSLSTRTATAVRAFRVSPVSLDGLVVAATCPEVSPDNPPVLVVTVDGVATGTPDCGERRDPDDEQAYWPADGDTATFWRSSGVRRERLHTVVVVLLPPGGGDPKPLTEYGVGVYGETAPEPDDPQARAEAVAGLEEPSTSYGGHPLLDTFDLSRDRWQVTVPVEPAKEWTAIVRFQCTPAADGLIVMVTVADDGAGTGCEGTRVVDLRVPQVEGDPDGILVAFEEGTVESAGNPLAKPVNLPPDAVIRVAVYLTYS